MPNIKDITKEIELVKDQLIDHPLYSNLNTIEDLQLFMQEHIYAVWDFMSLLKALQNHFTCTSVPWMPNTSPTLARFINEIVLGEECDENEKGEIKSHFEMYLDAMEEIGADCQPIHEFLNALRKGSDIKEAQQTASVSAVARKFLDYTFSIIDTKKPHLIAAAFTFGREDLIPDMFIGMVKHLSEKSGTNCTKLLYYLQRHIEVDGDDHGPLSLQMVEELCGDDAEKWAETKIVAVEAMKNRIDLWDGINSLIKERKALLV